MPVRRCLFSFICHVSISIYNLVILYSSLIQDFPDQEQEILQLNVGQTRKTTALFRTSGEIQHIQYVL